MALLAGLDLLLTADVLHSQHARRRLVDTFTAAGATSPSMACTPAALDVSIDGTWRQLLVEGRIREGPPGRFYLFAAPRSSTRERAIKMIVFYAVIVLIPIVLFLIHGR